MMDLEKAGFFFKDENNFLIKCYFCGNIFLNKDLQNHISCCHPVYKKNNANFGVPITLNQKDDFKTPLSYGKLKKHSSLDVIKEDESNCACCGKMISDVESELKIIQLRIDEEKRNRLQFEYTWLTELSKLHDRYTKTEKQQESIFTIFPFLQKTVNYDEMVCMEDVSNMSRKLKEISSELSHFQNSIDKLDFLINETKANCLTKSEEIINQFDEWRLKLENRMASLRSLNYEFEKLREDQICKSRSMLNLLGMNELLIENQEQCSEQIKLYGKDIETFKEVISEENQLIDQLQNEQFHQCELLKIDFKRTEEILKDLITWKEYVWKKLINLENKINTKDSEGIFEDVPYYINCYPNDLPVYSNGHLLWSIPNFKEQMEESKLSNVILLSPIFYTSEYGYKIQVRLHLNGLGQWKGRHMIISLLVMKSSWDSLLEWPFKMNTTVSIRNQTPETEKDKDIVKCFRNNIVNHDNETTKILQMFIPHRSLKESLFIKNNTIILEATVNVVNQ